MQFPNSIVYCMSSANQRISLINPFVIMNPTLHIQTYQMGMPSPALFIKHCGNKEMDLSCKHIFLWKMGAKVKIKPICEFILPIQNNEYFRTCCKLLYFRNNEMAHKKFLFYKQAKKLLTFLIKSFTLDSQRSFQPRGDKVLVIGVNVTSILIEVMCWLQQNNQFCC